jgi:predicted nucleic acid-binding Zn ribbon protein
MQTDDLLQIRRRKRRNRLFGFIAIFLLILMAVIVGRTYG